MKRQSIVFILLLLQVLLICIGCGSSQKHAEPAEFAVQETAVVTEESTPAEAAPAEVIENAIGVFEGLEDNHTAIFSFDGAETAFFFEDPAVQNVLYEAVIGSTYTLSYEYDNSLGYRIYQISEH
jgi:hypothetical protein